MRRHLALLVPLLALVLSGCARPAPPKSVVVSKEVPPIPDAKDDPLAYTNGLTNAERAVLGVRNRRHFFADEIGRASCRERV